MYRFVLLIVIASFASGCDLIGNENETIAGSYQAFEFRIVAADTTYDVLSEGGFLRMELEEDRTVQGEFIIPASIPGAQEPGEDRGVVEFAGSFEMAEGEVTFSHEADTFIRDALWKYEDGVLSTQEYFSYQEVRIVVKAR